MKRARIARKDLKERYGSYGGKEQPIGCPFPRSAAHLLLINACIPNGPADAIFIERDVEVGAIEAGHTDPPGGAEGGAAGLQMPIRRQERIANDRIGLPGRRPVVVKIVMVDGQAA